MVKGPAQQRILSMNLTGRLSKSQWWGLPNTFFFSLLLLLFLLMPHPVWPH